MAAYFCCLTAGGGIPLFLRTKGNLKPLPYPILGSLNGVHMFAKNHDVDLHSTTTEDSKVVWKVFHDSIILILVSQDDNSSDIHMSRLLEYIFQAMVLVYGQDELMNIKNADRFKREIRVSFRLVDTLLEMSEMNTFADLTHAVEVVVAPECNILQTYLDAFVDAASSPYGCLLINGKIAVATKKWWEMTALELILLSVLVTSLPKCSTRDIPIFLPVSSPTVPHRLLTMQLINGVELCVICGPSPSLSELEREVGRFWRSALDPLKSVAGLSPRNLASTIMLDQNILGFILTNTKSHKCLCTVCPSMDEKRTAGDNKKLSIEQRRKALRNFYKTIVGNLQRPETAETDRQEPCHDLYKHLRHQVIDTYICSDTHKCYAHQEGTFQIFVLYALAIPTYAMRSVTTKTLQMLLRDKSFLQFKE